jgi:hypothetical protein
MPDAQPEQTVERRATWRAEADSLQARLDTIESLSRATHDTLIEHIAGERGTKAAIDELVLLWRGSKLVVSGFKILIPIAAAALGAALWIKDHVKW